MKCIICHGEQVSPGEVFEGIPIGSDIVGSQSPRWCVGAAASATTIGLRCAIWSAFGRTSRKIGRDSRWSGRFYRSSEPEGR